ncbi:hypothetical protein R1sor_007865 [Riccia sorocarpa]|uniref:Uncharacterized protein n=1 Tax=Riccia sorocarpa TaxID=122646 RepID=A0ABD3HV57_9MARC
MEEEEVTRLEKKLKHAVDSTAEKLRKKVEQHHASSSARGSVEPPLRSAAYYEEGERKYRQRLTETRMVHKERWIEFARYGSTFYAMRNIPVPNLESIIVECRAEFMKAIGMYKPLPCDNDEHDHICEHGCNSVDCHICRLCAPAAVTAQSERDVFKNAKRYIVEEPLFARLNYGVENWQQLRDPMELRYKPTIWQPPDEAVASGTEEGPVGASQPSALHAAVVSPDLNVQPPDEADASGTEEGPVGSSQPSVLNAGVVSPDIIVQPMVAGHPSGQHPTSVPIREADQETVIATSTIIPTGEGSSQQIVWAVPGHREKYDRKPVFGPLTKHQIELSKGLEILMRFRRFGNIPPMQYLDLEELKPALDALKFLQHRHNELKAAVKTLNTEVQKLRRKKAALAVGVRAAVSWEGEEEVLGIFAENEHLKKEKESLLVQLHKKVDDVEMVLQRGGEGDDQGEEDEPRGPERTLVERPRYLADIEGRIELLLEAAQDAEMEEQRSDLH